MSVSKTRIPKKDRSIDVNCGCSDWNLRMILCVENFQPASISHTVSHLKYPVYGKDWNTGKF